jgi:hypothetical protein
MTVGLPITTDLFSRNEKKSQASHNGPPASPIPHSHHHARPHVGNELPASESYTLARGRVCVVPAFAMPDGLLAQTDLAQQVCDHRYYEVVQRTLGQDFGIHYFVIHDRAGHFCGAQPFFIVDQNILAGVQGKIAHYAGKVRNKYPRFMTLKTLMLGNPAGPGALGVVSAAHVDRSGFVAALSEVLAAYSRRHRVRIVVFKDFPAEHRHDMRRLTDGSCNGSAAGDFVRLPSMPMTGLSLAPYASFDDYMTRSLSKITRKGLRRKFKLTGKEAGETIDFSVTNCAENDAEEIHRLYLQVYDRASMKFEKLTPSYFRELGRQMPDRARFFLWKRQGKLVAASVTLARLGGPESALYDLYLGMEYPLALDLSLYFLTMRDVIQWCIDNRIANYYSTPLNYDSKLHLRHRLIPLDLYVRHTSPVLNPPFKLAMHFAEPTRHDKILPRFANFHDLKGSS